MVQETRKLNNLKHRFYCNTNKNLAYLLRRIQKIDSFQNFEI